jgi:hypothetical protein
MNWHTMSKNEFVEKMVALDVRYKPRFFPSGAWRQNGSVLSAYDGKVIVGQYDCATGTGWYQEGGDG